jgi:hypothetical protein
MRSNLNEVRVRVRVKVRVSVRISVRVRVRFRVRVRLVSTFSNRNPNITVVCHEDS